MAGYSFPIVAGGLFVDGSCSLLRNRFAAHLFLVRHLDGVAAALVIIGALNWGNVTDWRSAAGRRLSRQTARSDA